MSKDISKYFHPSVGSVRGGVKRVNSSPEMIRSPTRARTQDVGSEQATCPSSLEIILERFTKLDSHLEERFSSLERKIELMASKEEVEDLRCRVKGLEEIIKSGSRLSASDPFAVDKRLDKMENQLREKNLIIKGLELEKDKDVSAQVSDFLRRKLEVNVTGALEAKTLRGSKLILASFSSLESVRDVLRNCQKLRGTKVSVQKDLAPRSRKIRSGLLLIRKKLRSCSEDLKISMGREDLAIGSFRIAWNDSAGGFKCMRGSKEAIAEFGQFMGLTVEAVKNIVELQGTRTSGDSPTAILKKP